MRLCFGSGIVFGLGALVFGAVGCGSTFSAAGGDGGAEDGGVVEGGGAEASVAFCANAGQHFFCDDFDNHPNGEVKGSQWDGILSTGNASLTIDTVSPRSPPGDLLVQLTNTGDTSGDQAALAKKVGRARVLTLEYDTLIDTYGNLSNATPSSVASPVFFAISSNVNMALGLITPDTAYFYESSGGSQTVSHQLATGIPTGQWTHVLLRIQPPNVSLQKGNVHIEINGKLALDSELSVAQNLVNVDSTLDLGLPIFPPNGNAQAKWSIHFDNVVIDRTLLP